MEYMGYCVKCKKKVAIKNAKEITSANGRLMAKGVCPNCGTKVNLFLPKK